MKSFCFTIDDNIRFLKEITESGVKSIFDHPYTAMLKRLHEGYDIRVQLNLFYREGDFELSCVSGRYASEWEGAADWLKLSFHSECEAVSPYTSSSYAEVLCDAARVKDEILRFASEASLAKTTTVHYCDTTREGARALRDAGSTALLGLYGTESEPRSSYGLSDKIAERIRTGETVVEDGIAYASIDCIINTVRLCDIDERIKDLLSRDSIRVMIHEQYFYPDYKAYQPDFEEKLARTLKILTENGYRSVFFEQII